MSITHPAQILETTGGVNRTLGDKLGEIVSVRDYGAKGDDSTDDTAAFQTALNAIGPSGTARTLIIPVGNFVISGAQVLSGFVGARIAGSGYGSIIKWKGNATDPVFSVSGCRETTFSDFRIQPYSASFPMTSVIVQEQPSLGTGLTSTMNTYRRVQIAGLGVITQGIYVKGDVTDANNDFNNFEQVFVNGYTEAGILLQGANSFSNRIINCQMGGGAVGHYGVKAIDGAGGESAQFSIHGGACLGHTTADTYIQSRSAQAYLIDNLYSESSVAYLIADGVHGVATSIIIRGARFTTAVIGAAPIIKILNPGPVLIENSLLGTDYTKLAKIQWQYVAANAPPSFRVVNTTVSGTANTLAGVFTVSKPTYLSDAFWRTGGTVYGPLALNPFVTLTFATGGATSIAAIDASVGWANPRPIIAKTVATTALQFGFSNPTNLISGQIIYYQIKNASGGALNAASPFQDTLFRAGAYVPPGNGQNRTYGFFYDGAFLYAIRQDADVAN